MNKLLTGLMLSGLLTSLAFSDMLRMEMGAGIWQQEVSGPITNGSRTYESDQLGFDKEMQTYAWMSIKHPVPVLPNLRLEYSNIDFNGDISQTIASNTLRSVSKVSLQQYDAVLYYNILDNTGWTTLDLGLDVKYVDAIFKIDNTLNTIPVSSLNIDENKAITLPLLYTRARFSLPLSLGIEGIGKYVEYKNTSMLDAQIKVDYTLVDVLPFELGLELGYKIEKLDLDAGDFSGISTSADVKVKGVFAGAIVRF